MIYCFISYSKLSIFMRITLFAYFCLFFHGLVDLVLFHWPTIYIAAILLGILWAETWKTNVKHGTLNSEPQKTKPLKKKTNINRRDTWCVSNKCVPDKLKFIIYPTAFLILAFTLHNVYSDYRSTYFFRTGDFFAKEKKDERAVFQYQEGLAYKKDPKYIYKAGMLSITSLNNPELALHFFNYFNKIASYDYAHKNGYTALALLKLGKNKLTLPYLLKEVINYPLSAAAWFRLSLMQSHLKLNKAAEFSLKNAQKAILHKGLPPNALKLLVENPEYDSHPEQIPKEILDNLKKKQRKKKKI